MTKYYKSKRRIDGKAIWIIVDDTGKIINRNPSNVKLKGLEIMRRKCIVHHNDTNTCYMIKGDDKPCSRSLLGNSYREYDKNGSPTGKWICKRCYNIDYVRQCVLYYTSKYRTGDQDQNSSTAKGDLV